MTENYKETEEKAVYDGVKTALMVLFFLSLGTIGALLLPTRVKLELYDVQDLTYAMSDFSSTAISLSPAIEDRDLMTGEDLANDLQAIVPGSWEESAGRTIQFQNGLLIVRATALQQVAVRMRLAVHRARMCIAEWMHAARASLKPGVSTGMSS